MNIYDLLSDAIEDGLGNTSSQKQNIATLFIDGLFSDKFGEMKFEVTSLICPPKYRVIFEGYEGVGNTPALALKDLLCRVVNGLYYIQNGQP